MRSGERGGAIAILLLLFVATGQSTVVADQQVESYNDCLVRMLQSAADNTPVGQVKKACQEDRSLPTAPESPEPVKAEAKQSPATEKKLSISRRTAYEIEAHANPFALIPHKPNYILLGSYNAHPNNAPLELDENEVDNTEVKFQMSLKIPVARNFIGGNNGFLYAAYTAKSFWQAYNSDVSSPFRETNHEPEMFIGYRNNKEIIGWNNTYILAGFSHQSNGRRGTFSRSWNRLYLDFLFEKDELALSFKPWYRIPESSKDSPADPSGDDNPDISRYLGYGELTGAYRRGDHTCSIMLRNNLRTHQNRGAVELGWSFPITRISPFKGYLQYFNGYGESLIDYNAAVSRIGFGLLLTDWL